jgi:hypothetical protein
MENIHDLKNSTNLEERLSYEFFITLLDQLFGQHDQIRIDMSTETEQNQGIIKLQWKMIKQYYQLPSSVKKTQKLVRQTLLGILNRLNHKYQFKNPIQFEPKRHDFRDKETGKPAADLWNEIKLV